MMKRYKIGDNYYLYEEGTQPACAVEDKPAKEVKAEEPKTEEPKASVAAKVKIPSNKAKGVKAK